MNDFIWISKKPHSDNTFTMSEFLEKYLEMHCGSGFKIEHQDGSYAEIRNEDNLLFGVHASGNGDFFNHKVTFESLI